MRHSRLAVPAIALAGPLLPTVLRVMRRAEAAAASMKSEAPAMATPDPAK